MKQENIKYQNPKAIEKATTKPLKLDKEKSKELTGYASIDKPWLKYYTKEAIESPLPSGTMYDYILQNAEGNMNKIALNYFDRKITYKELFDNIETTATALLSQNVQKGDIVTIAMPTTPESIYLLYALNKIGAIGNFVDPRTSKEGIEKYIKDAKSSLVFTLDSISDKLKDVDKNVTIINVSPTESMETKAKLEQIKKLVITQKAMLLKNPKLTKKGNISITAKALKQVIKGLKESKQTYGYKNCLQWQEFFDNQQVIMPEKYKYKSLYPNEKDPAVIVHTGGTTGMPKGVLLSNQNINSAAYDCCAAGYDFQSNQSWLNIMPLFIAYGCGNGLHLPLACKMEVIIIPAFDSKEFPNLLDKYKPNHMVGVPEHYGNIVKSEILKNQDLSYIIAPTVGGDAMNISLEEKTNQFLKEHNCDYKVVKGYGMTEVCAAVCACTSNETNEIGSVGIPFPHSTISIFDESTGEEMPYGIENIGEICVNTPNMMIGYHNNEEETNKILKKHQDGNIWVHSGDLGYMNENGELFIIGRSKDMIVRHDGFKIYPNQIENTILKDPAVKECRVVGVEDKQYVQGKVPVAFVVPNENYPNLSQTRENIQTLCEIELQEYSQPSDIQFIEKMPLTNIGKIDLKALQENYNQEKQKVKTIK